MARPKVINPTGSVRAIRVLVAEPVVQRLEREAAERGVTFAHLVRERLGS